MNTEKPLKGWTLQQWEDFKKEAFQSFCKWYGSPFFSQTPGDLRFVKNNSPTLWKQYLEGTIND
jgi:hypothetical protein